jgi:hypothetical protein
MGIEPEPELITEAGTSVPVGPGGGPENGGVSALIRVKVEFTVGGGENAPLKVTFTVGRKPAPEMITLVPPTIGPSAGCMFETVGVLL